jgi:hypothetical protein
MFSVKSIFITLIATIFFIVLSSLFIEFVNVQMTGIQINQIAKMSAQKSAELMAQETYKSRSGASATVNMPNLNNTDGNFYLTGTFYTMSPPQTSISTPLSTEQINSIYANLYGPGSPFETWVTTDIVTVSGGSEGTGKPNEIWKTIHRMSLYDGSTDGQLGQMYRESHMTPLNLGIPYLDQSTLEVMFRWNLTQLFSGCDPDSIQSDTFVGTRLDGSNLMVANDAYESRFGATTNGQYYINYKGFRVFASQAKIEELVYKVFDTSDADGAAAFEAETHINPANLGFGDTLDMFSMDSQDERTNICVVGIKYSVPIAYEGITPLRQIMQFAWDSGVEGYYDEGNAAQQGLGGEDYSRTISESQYAGMSNPGWIDDLEQGGFSSGAGMNANENRGQLPIPGDLVYYVVR